MVKHCFKLHNNLLSIGLNECRQSVQRCCIAGKNNRSGRKTDAVCVCRSAMQSQLLLAAIKSTGSNSVLSPG